MEYAVIATGGKQYKVGPGTLLDVETVSGQAGDSVRLEQVLAVKAGDQLQIGRPRVSGAWVAAEIVRQHKGEKVVHYRFRRRKGYHRKVGHRQLLTRLKILEIHHNGTH